MTRRRDPILAQLSLLAMVLAACGDAGLTETDEIPIRAASVGAAPGGTGFYFLPPLVANPTAFTGAFDANANPVVEICVPFGRGCSLPLVARFVMGKGADNIRVDTDAQHYIVNWNTRGAALDANRTYRIRVRVGLNDLGYADVKPPRGTLPIKFRIEQGAVTPPGPASAQLETGNTASASIGPDGGQLFTVGADGTRYTFVVPAGAVTSNVAISMTPIANMHNLPLAGGFVGGVHFEPSGLQFARLTSLTMQFTSVIPPRNFTTLLHSADGALTGELVPVFNGSAVTLSLAHFSDAAGGMGTAPQQPCAPGMSQYDCIEADILWNLAQVMKYIADIQAAGGSVNWTDATNPFRQWAAAIQSEIAAASTADPDGVATAIGRAMRWLGYAQTLGVDGYLLAEWSAIEAAMTQMYIAQIDRQDMLCTTLQNLDRRVLGLQYASDAALLGLDMPALYQTTNVDVWHCGEPAISSITLPAQLTAGKAEDLSVNYGISYAGGQATHIRPLKFTLVLSGTTTDGTFDEKDVGPHNRSITPRSGANNVNVQATACFDLPGKTDCATKSLNVPLKAGIARLTALGCSVSFGTVYTAYSEGQQLSLNQRCSPASPSANGNAASAGSGAIGSASSSISTTMSATGADPTGRFDNLAVNMSTKANITASGNDSCTDTCADANANFQGRINVVVTADAPLVLEVKLITGPGCGGNLANGWQWFVQNFNRWNWVGCNTTLTFVIRLAAGQEWDYDIGTEVWLKGAAYGKNSSISWDANGDVRLEVTVKPQ